MKRRPQPSRNRPADGRPPAGPAHARGPAWSWNRTALALLVLWALVIGWTTMVGHPTPLYSAESDTIGEYIPAARELRHGVLTPSHYATKGIGYPLMLAAAGGLAGGDDYLAARALNVVAAVAGGGGVFLLFRAFLGAEAGVFVLAGLLLNPNYARLSIEAGTDLPTFALLIASTLLLAYGARSRRLFAAGLLAGLAAVTRYNSLFLVPAALLVLIPRPRPGVAIGAWAAGLALPLGAWWLLAHRLGIALLGSGNAFNMAYEVYGRALSIDAFGAAAGRQFHGFLDVVRYQPLSFAAHVARNLGTRWLQDMRVLLPVWLGVLAVPGLVIGWWRRPGWPAMAAHLTLCYATLAAIFYLPRFGLYLVPFYLSGVVALVLEARWPRRGHADSRSGRWNVLRPALLAVLMLASGWKAVAEVRTGLANAPHETRAGGQFLKGLVRPGDRVMARKPNVSYFAGADYTPLPDPDVTDFPGLLRHARTNHTRFLFFSMTERATRPQFGLLAYPGVNLPGLRQLDYQVLDPTRFYALYEFDAHPTDDRALGDSVVALLRGAVAQMPDQPWPHAQLAQQLLNLGRAREALDELAVCERMVPTDPTVAKLQIQAHQQLGELEQEAAACERAIRIGSRDGLERGALGRVRLQQRRWPEAVAALDSALAIDPGNVEYRTWRAQAEVGAGDVPAARADLAHVLGLRPDHAGARVLTARLLAREGRTSEALAALAAARPADSAAAREVRELADSLRSDRRSGGTRR